MAPNHPAGMSDGDWDEAADQFYDPHAFCDGRIRRLQGERDELLAALKGLVDDLKARWDMNHPSTNPGIRHHVEQADAAIAKAESNG